MTACRLAEKILIRLSGEKISVTFSSISSGVKLSFISVKTEHTKSDIVFRSSLPISSEVFPKMAEIRVNKTFSCVSSEESTWGFCLVGKLKNSNLFERILWYDSFCELRMLEPSLGVIVFANNIIQHPL